ncbi:MAG: insulinase family protein [Clostridia bacterium]|nr:insulinase family protein [Clostridia bacterium]
MAKLYTFDSGLKLLYEVNNINKSTSIEIGFDCGARCDGENAGLSHFCEHMFFTGTDKLSKQEVSKRYFDFIRANAYTSNTDIVFNGTIITSKLASYLRCVQDMICNSNFNTIAVEEEKKVVIQEIVRDADQHSRHADRLRKYELYKLEYFNNGVLGSKESVSKIASKDVKNYVKKYFVKNNCIISICTPLSFNKVKKIIKNNFDNIMPSNKLKPLLNDSDKLVDEESVKIYHKAIDKNFVSVIFKSNRKGPDLKYRVLLGTISNLIDDISDGLTKELRLDKGLVYGMWDEYMINKVNSYLELYTEISSQNIKPCLDTIFDYVNKLVDKGFTKQQFNKELEKDEYYWQTRVERPENIVSRLTRHRFYDKFVSDKDVHDEVQRLTLEEVNKAMRELFKNAKIQVFVYGDAQKTDVYSIKQLLKKFNT